MSVTPEHHTIPTVINREYDDIEQAPDEHNESIYAELDNYLNIQSKILWWTLKLYNALEKLGHYMPIYNQLYCIPSTKPCLLKLALLFYKIRISLMTMSLLLVFINQHSDKSYIVYGVASGRPQRLRAQHTDYSR